MLRGAEQFGDGDDRRQRGVFEQADEGVGQRRHGDAEGLRQDDAVKGLHIGHADGVARFPLHFGHGEDRGADGFRGVGADVQGEADDGGGQGIEDDADGGQAVKDDHELHEHGRAAYGGYVEFHQQEQDGVQYSAARHDAHQGNGERNHQPENEGDDGKRYGVEKAGFEHRPEGVYDQRGARFAHEWQGGEQVGKGIGEQVSLVCEKGRIIKDGVRFPQGMGITCGYGSYGFG